jgi:hypothetical protein
MLLCDFTTVITGNNEITWFAINNPLMVARLVDGGCRCRGNGTNDDGNSDKGDYKEILKKFLGVVFDVVCHVTFLPERLFN